jgi:hypothetical protein
MSPSAVASCRAEEVVDVLGLDDERTDVDVLTKDLGVSG